jgi:predicted nucleic acid-binding protein
MILIDTSAWIQFFRPKGSPNLKGQVSEAIQRESAAFTCPVRLELLTGARPTECRDLEIGLSFATRIPLLPEHWDQAATFASRLQLKGLKVPLSDLLIATVAQASGIPVLCDDKHFALIQQSVVHDLLIL